MARTLLAPVATVRYTRKTSLLLGGTLKRRLHDQQITWDLVGATISGHTYDRTPRECAAVRTERLMMETAVVWSRFVPVDDLWSLLHCAVRVVSPTLCAARRHIQTHVAQRRIAGPVDPLLNTTDPSTSVRVARMLNTQHIRLGSTDEFNTWMAIGRASPPVYLQCAWRLRRSSSVNIVSPPGCPYSGSSLAAAYILSGYDAQIVQAVFRMTGFNPNGPGRGKGGLLHVIIEAVFGVSRTSGKDMGTLCPNLVLTLVELGCPLESRDGNGRSPLTLLVALACLDLYHQEHRKIMLRCLCILLDSGCRLDAADLGGRNPLHMLSYLPNDIMLPVLDRMAPFISSTPNAQVQRDVTRGDTCKWRGVRVSHRRRRVARTSLVVVTGLTEFVRFALITVQNSEKWRTVFEEAAIKLVSHMTDVAIACSDYYKRNALCILEGN